MARQQATPQKAMETVVENNEKVRRQRTDATGEKLGWRLRTFDPRTGKQPEVTFYGTYEEAVRELDRLTKEQTAQQSPAPKNVKAVTFEDWTEQWLLDYVWKTKPSKNFPGVRRPLSTWSKARNMMDYYLLPAVGPTMKMRRITHKVLDDAIGGLERADGQPLAGSSKTTVASVARSCFRDAKKAGIIVNNPAADLPTVWDDGGTSRTALVPSILDMEKLARAMDETWPLPRWCRDLAGPDGEGHGDLVRLLAYSGLRFEEFAALEAVRVVRELRTMYVSDTASESGGLREHRTNEGKTRAAERHLLIVDQLLPVLDRLDAIRERGRFLEEGRAARRAARGSKRKPNRDVHQLWTLLVCGEYGGFVSYGHWRKKLAVARQASGVDYTAHELRHIAASILIASGASDDEVAEQMAHASAKTTRRVYRHLFRVDRTELARRVSAGIEVITAGERAAAEAEVAAEDASAGVGPGPDPNAGE